MKLRTLTLEKINLTYTIDQLKKELLELKMHLNEQDKICLIDTYLCLSNLYEHESDYLNHVIEFEDCIKNVIQCFKNNQNKSIKVCLFIVSIFEFDLQYAKDHKVIRLIA